MFRASLKPSTFVPVSFSLSFSLSLALISFSLLILCLQDLKNDIAREGDAARTLAQVNHDDPLAPEKVERALEALNKVLSLPFHFYSLQPIKLFFLLMVD
jgi:hypothetical protein